MYLDNSSPLSGAWGLCRVCLGDPAGRQPQRQDRQQHVGEGDPQCGLKGGPGGLLRPQLRVQGRAAAGDQLIWSECQQ